MSRPFVLFAGLIIAFTGCGEPTSTVQGTVTIDGQLARQGTVVFHPVGGGPQAYGSIAEDGTYAIRVGQGDLDDPNSGDVPTGEYIVTVVVNMPSSPDELVGESGPPKPGATLTAEKYGSADTSDLRHTVKAGRNVIPLELEGSSADAATEDVADTADEAKDSNDVDPGAEAPKDEEAPVTEPTEPTTSPAPESEAPSAAPGESGGEKSP